MQPITTHSAGQRFSDVDKQYLGFANRSEGEPQSQSRLGMHRSKLASQRRNNHDNFLRCTESAVTVLVWTLENSQFPAKSQERRSGAPTLCPDRRDRFYAAGGDIARYKPASAGRRAGPALGQRQMRSGCSLIRIELVEGSLGREQRVLIIAADDDQVRSRLRSHFLRWLPRSVLMPRPARASTPFLRRCRIATVDGLSHRALVSTRGSQKSSRRS